MPNPKKRKTTSAKNQRRSHHALKAVKVSACEKCGSAKKAHYACPACGFYNGKETKIEKKAPAKKATPKKKAVKAEAKEQKADKTAKKAEKK